MPELSASTVRVEWDPASAKLVLLDWGDRVPAPLALPWEQQTADEALVGAAAGWFAALGNVRRELRFGRRVYYATAHALQAALLAHDASLPGGLKKTVEIRLVKTPDPGGTVAARTQSLWTGTGVLASASPEPDVAACAATYTYRLKLGALVQT